MALVFCWSTAAGAAEFHSLEVEYRDGVYHMSAEISLDAPPAQVRYVITDYNHLTWISGAVLESQFLDRPAPDVAVFHMLLRVCFGPFCENVSQVLRMHEAVDGPYTLRAEALPRYSDVEFSETVWRIEPDGEDGTRLYWSSRMKPRFWVPPVVGPAMVESSLRSYARYTAQGIEKLAREWAEIHGAR